MSNKTEQLELELVGVEKMKGIDSILSRVNGHYDNEIKRMIDNRDNIANEVKSQLGVMTAVNKHLYGNKTDFSDGFIPGDILDFSGLVGLPHGVGLVGNGRATYRSYKQYLSAYGDYGFYIDEYGVLWGFGNNTNSRLGIPNGRNYYEDPVQVSDMVGWDCVYVSSTLSIGRIKGDSQTADSLYVWGVYEQGDKRITIEEPTLIDTAYLEPESFGSHYYVNVYMNETNSFVILKQNSHTCNNTKLPMLIPYGNNEYGVNEFCEAINSDRTEYSYINWEMRSSSTKFMFTLFSVKYGNEGNGLNDEDYTQLYISGYTDEEVQDIKTKWLEGKNESVRTVTTKDVVCSIELTYDSPVLWDNRREGNDRVVQVLKQEVPTPPHGFAEAIDRIKLKSDSIFKKDPLPFPYRSNDMVIYLGMRQTRKSHPQEVSHLIVVRHEKYGKFEKARYLYLTDEELSHAVRIPGMESGDHECVKLGSNLDPLYEALVPIEISNGRSRDSLFTLHLTFDEIMDVYYGNNDIIRIRLHHLERYINDDKELTEEAKAIRAALEDVVEEARIKDNDITLPIQLEVQKDVFHGGYTRCVAERIKGVIVSEVGHLPAKEDLGEPIQKTLSSAASTIRNDERYCIPDGRYLGDKLTSISMSAIDAISTPEAQELLTKIEDKEMLGLLESQEVTDKLKMSEGDRRVVFYYSLLEEDQYEIKKELFPNMSDIELEKVSNDTVSDVLRHLLTDEHKDSYPKVFKLIDDRM